MTDDLERRLLEAGPFVGACGKGHPRTPANTIITRRGYPRCLVCERGYNKASYQRRKHRGK